MLTIPVTCSYDYWLFGATPSHDQGPLTMCSRIALSGVQGNMLCQGRSLQAPLGKACSIHLVEPCKCFLRHLIAQNHMGIHCRCLFSMFGMKPEMPDFKSHMYHQRCYPHPHWEWQSYEQGFPHLDSQDSTQEVLTYSRILEPKLFWNLLEVNWCKTRKKNQDCREAFLDNTFPLATYRSLGVVVIYSFIKCMVFFKGWGP